MNRLSRAAVLVTVRLGTLAPVVPASTGTGPIDGVVVSRESGHDLHAIPRVVVTLIRVAIAMVNRIRKLCSS